MAAPDIWPRMTPSGPRVPFQLDTPVLPVAFAVALHFQEMESPFAIPDAGPTALGPLHVPLMSPLPDCWKVHTGVVVYAICPFCSNTALALQVPEKSAADAALAVAMIAPAKSAGSTETTTFMTFPSCARSFTDRIGV